MSNLTNEHGHNITLDENGDLKRMQAFGNTIEKTESGFKVIRPDGSTIRLEKDGIRIDDFKPSKVSISDIAALASYCIKETDSTTEHTFKFKNEGHHTVTFDKNGKYLAQESTNTLISITNENELVISQAE